MSTHWPGEDLHTVLVCHSIDTGPANNVANFWEFASALFAKHGCPITHITDEKSPKYRSFTRLRKKLMEMLETSVSFCITSSPEGINEVYFKYLAKADIVLRRESPRLYLDMKYNLLDIRSTEFKAVMQTFVRTFTPRYCYGYLRPFKNSPDLYAYNIGDGRQPPNERWTNWSYYGARNDEYLKHGWLREVYALNYLTDAHLLAPVGNITLKQWILQSPNRGTLTPVTKEMMLWEVPDERLTELSDQLYAAGRVFDAERDVLSKRSPPTDELSMEEATTQVLQAFGFESPDEVEIRKGDNKPISDEEKKRLFQKKPKK